VALVDFDIASTAPFGPMTPFRLANCVLSDANGMQIPCNPCPEPGRVTVRPAGSFGFRPIASPVGVVQFDPLPFPSTVEALTFSGSSAPFNGVAKADVNADDAVNVLDVVRSINFSLNLPVSGPPLAPPLPFQRWAANMLDQSCAVDSLINVLDIVRIRNKALGRPPLCPCGAGGVGVLTGQPAVLASPVTPFSISVEKAGTRDYLVTVHGAVALSGRP